MKRYTPWLVGVIAAGALFACSNDDSSSGRSDGGGSSGSSSGLSSGSDGSGSSSGMSSSSGGSGSSGGPSSPGISLTVNSASSPSMVGGAPPSGSNVFVVVDLTLKNTGASMALSANFVLFSLQTRQSLVVSAAPEQPPNQCSPTVSVATGGQIECQVAFEMPAGQTPATLLYDDQRGDKASASVPAIPMSSACETVQGWLNRATAACLTCFSDAEARACASRADAYRNSCSADSSACAACASNPTNLCSCESGCDNSACQSLFGAEMACVASACSATCP